VTLLLRAGEKQPHRQKKMMQELQRYIRLWAFVRFNFIVFGVSTFFLPSKKSVQAQAYVG
jgi:uncharacterized membrane protein